MEVPVSEDLGLKLGTTLLLLCSISQRDTEPAHTQGEEHRSLLLNGNNVKKFKVIFNLLQVICFCLPGASLGYTYTDIYG